MKNDVFFFWKGREGKSREGSGRTIEKLVQDSAKLPLIRGHGIYTLCN